VYDKGEGEGKGIGSERSDVPVLFPGAFPVVVKRGTERRGAPSQSPFSPPFDFHLLPLSVYQYRVYGDGFMKPLDRKKSR
jgi:hypothetical protein